MHCEMSMINDTSLNKKPHFYIVTVSKRDKILIKISLSVWRWCIESAGRVWNSSSEILLSISVEKNEQLQQTV